MNRQSQWTRSYSTPKPRISTASPISMELYQPRTHFKRLETSLKTQLPITLAPALFPLVKFHYHCHTYPRIMSGRITVVILDFKSLQRHCDYKHVHFRYKSRLNRVVISAHFVPLCNSIRGARTFTCLPLDMKSQDQGTGGASNRLPVSWLDFRSISLMTPICRSEFHEIQTKVASNKNITYVVFVVADDIIVLFL